MGIRHRYKSKSFFPKSQLLNISQSITGWSPTIFIWPSLPGDSDAASVGAGWLRRPFMPISNPPRTLPLPLPSPILPHPHAQCLSLELDSLQIYLCFTQPDFTHRSKFPVLLILFLYRKMYDFSGDPVQIPALSYIYIQDSIKSHFFLSDYL